jgi:hypothetical protein
MRWFVESGLLGLVSPRFQAFFSPEGISYAPFPAHDEAHAVSTLELLERAKSSGTEIGELEFEADGGRIVAYKTESGTNVAADDLLESIGRTLGSQLRVRAAAALLGTDTRQLRCDLISRRAYGKAGAKFYLSEMLTSALPLLRAMLSRELSALYSLAHEDY